jgi:ribose transport system permease protein
MSSQVSRLLAKVADQPGRRMPTLLPALTVVGIMLIVYGSVRANAFSSFNMQELATATATLAILAVGQTVIVISGGFDFSAVALLAFLNSFFVTQLDTFSHSYVLTAIVVLAIGVGIGVINGVLVAYLRIQSIIATIAMFFVLSGGALTLLSRPGGTVSSGFSDALSGTWGPIPASAGVIAIAAVVWLVVARLRFGTNLYGVGSSARAAFARGVAVKPTLVAAYAVAGLFYAIASLNYTAATASGDPRISFVLLGQMFAAVIIGGTVFGGGRGGAIGSILGAFSLTLLDAILFSIGFESFYTGIVFGLVLLLVVLPSSVGGKVAEAVKRLRRTAKTRRAEPASGEA